MTNALRWNAPICRSYPYTEKVLPRACKSYLAWCLNGRPCKSLLNDQHGRFWRSFLNWVPKTTATAHLCPPCLSTMTRRVYTSRLSFPQWHGYLRKRTFHQGHTKTAWRNDITFPKLYIVASLMKHHYSNESFCRGQGTPLHLEFIEFWYERVSQLGATSFSKIYTALPTKGWSSLEWQHPSVNFTRAWLTKGWAKSTWGNILL